MLALYLIKLKRKTHNTGIPSLAFSAEVFKDVKRLWLIPSFLSVTHASPFRTSGYLRLSSESKYMCDQDLLPFTPTLIFALYLKHQRLFSFFHGAKAELFCHVITLAIDFSIKEVSPTKYHHRNASVRKNGITAHLNIYGVPSIYISI